MEKIRLYDRVHQTPNRTGPIAKVNWESLKPVTTLQDHFPGLIFVGMLVLVTIQICLVW